MIREAIKGEEEECCDSFSAKAMVPLAVATSIDALAVGVTLKMAALSEIGLAMGVWGATAVIGAVTCGLSIAAVFIGKKVGNKLADKAGLLGGAVLLAIGIKILIEGLI